MAVDTKDQSREPHTVIPPIGCLSLQPWLSQQSHSGSEANQSEILETKNSNHEGKDNDTISWQLLPDSVLVWMRKKAVHYGPTIRFFPTVWEKMSLDLEYKKVP